MPVTELVGLLRLFPAPPDTHVVRYAIDVAAERVSDSCGYAVPPMSYEGGCDLLIRPHSRRTDVDLAKYRRVKNAASSDGWRSSRRPTGLDQHL